MIRKFTVKKFLGLTFLIMGLANGLSLYLLRVTAIPFSHGTIQVLQIIGGGSPTIAAFVLMGIHYDPGMKRDFYRRLFLLRVSPGWWLYAILGPLAILGTLQLMVYGDLERVSLAYRDWLRFPLWLLISIFAGGLEEIGWRGVMLDHLRDRLPLPALAVITGVVWALWHYPLFLFEAYGFSSFNLLPYLLSTIMFSGFLTYLVVRSGSIGLAVVMHAAINAFSNYGLGFPKIESSGIYGGLIILGLVGLGLLHQEEKNSRTDKKNKNSKQNHGSI